MCAVWCSFLPTVYGVVLIAHELGYEHVDPTSRLFWFFIGQRPIPGIKKARQRPD